MQYDFAQAEKNGEAPRLSEMLPVMMGQSCGSVREIKPAAAIIEEMMSDCIATLRNGTKRIAKL